MLVDSLERGARAVSETTTALVSVGSGVLWDILLGGALALAFYFLEPAVPGRGSVRTDVLAGSGFLTVSVAPWLVLPPTTPGADQAFDPTARIAIHVGTMAVGALVAAASIYGYGRGAARSRPLGVTTAAVPIAVLVAATSVAAPALVEAGAMPTDDVSGAVQRGRDRALGPAAQHVVLGRHARRRSRRARVDVWSGRRTGLRRLSSGPVDFEWDNRYYPGNRNLQRDKRSNGRALSRYGKPQDVETVTA